MKKYPVFYNREPINFIEDFEKTTLTGVIKSNSSYINGIDNVILKKEKSDYSIEFNEFKVRNKRRTYDLGKVIRKIRFISPEYTIILKNVFISNISKGYTAHFYESKFPKKKRKYFKFIIPLKEKINFSFQLQPYSYCDEYNSGTIVGCSVEVENEEVFVLHRTVKNHNVEKHYLVIESNKKQFFDDFSQKVFALRVSLGYIIGKFSGERGYYFSYSNKIRNKFDSFCFQTQRGEINNFLQPINSNPYSWLHGRNKSVAEKIYKSKELRTLTKNEFSNLFKLTLENDGFLAIVLLMLESSESSLLLRPGGYSIILESLSSIIIGGDNEKFNPITPRKEAKRFREELLDVLKNYEDNEHFKDVETLKGRINNINQITNKEKLILPFKILGIELSEEDKKVIGSRNDFLHGRIPDYKNLGENRGISQKDRDMYYASVRFYTLINLLILKYIGYDSYVLNFSKIFENDTTYLVKEDFYRK